MAKKVIVIGGGIIGLSIAYRLAKSGFPVTVLEKNSVGREASWAAAGMLRPQAEFEDERVLRLCLESIRLYPEFADELKEDTKVDIHYRIDGTIIAAVNDGQFDELKERYDEQRKLGLDVEWLSRDNLLKLEPYVSERILGSVLIKGDHWADSRLILEGLVKGVKKHKGEIVENCEAVSYVFDGNIVVGVETNKGKFLGDFVVNCAGSWAGLIMANDEMLIPPIKPVRGQLIEIETPDWMIKHNVCTYGTYLAAKNKNRVLIGSTMEDVGFEKKVTEEGIEMLMRNAVELVPKIKECRIVDKWAGFRPTAPDRMPILGRTNAEGLLIATGTYRNGILLAPVIGKLISEIIVYGRVDKLIEPFGIGRFYV